MANDLFDQLGQTLTEIGRLKEYLQSDVETSGERVKITIRNTAPEDTNLPRVVFVGVGLSASGVDFRCDLKVTRSSDVHADNAPTKLHTEKYYRLANREFRRLDNKQFIEKTPYDDQQGEMLYPGQWIQYEMSIPIAKALYLTFKVEGIVSPRHLFHGSKALSVDLSQVKAKVTEALKALNTFQVHRVLINVTNHIPAFDGNTKFSEVQAFNESLSGAIIECESLTKSLNPVFHQYPFPWFQAHLHATFNYLDIMMKGLKRVQETIASNRQYDIITEVNKLKTEVVEQAYQLNKDTEEILAMFQIADEEVGYKYRAGIETWDNAAIQRLQTVFSDPKLWSLLPEQAKRSMIDADRTWASGSAARSESVLNEVRIAAEQLLTAGLWNQLEASEAFRNTSDWHRQRFSDLKAEFLENCSQPSLLCLQRVCQLHVSVAYLQSKGVSEKDVKWFTEQLPDSLHRLRQARNMTEHEATQMSRNELQPFVNDFLGTAASPGVLFRMARILLA